MQFRKLQPADRPWADAALAGTGRRGCEYAFSCAMMWQDVFGLTCAVGEDFFTMRLEKGARSAYLFPAARGGAEGPVRELLAHSGSRGEKMRFYSLTEEDRRQLEALFPGRFSFVPQPHLREYLYERESLTTLAGKKLHAKRNFCNRFEQAHPDWAFEPLTRENLPACRAMHERWLASVGEASGSLNGEALAVDVAFEHFFDLGLQGGMLRAGGEIVAYAMGEMLHSDTYDVRVEKARYDVPGAYAMINREFARAFTAPARYINREDDAGDEGLRKAKLSYRPALLLEKYTAEER